MRKTGKIIFSFLVALSMIGCSGQTGGATNNECSNGADGKNGSQIYTGQGKPSNSVGSVGDIYIDSISGDLYSKGESGWIKTGNIKGATGDNGADGVSILSVSKSSTDGNVDTYTIYYSNGSTSTFKVTNGSDGVAGAQGEKGEDGHTPIITIGTNGHWYVDGVDTGVSAKGDTGISVKRAYIDANGDLICVLSDGSTVNAGHVKDVSKRYANFYVDDELVQTVSVRNGDKVSAPSADVTAGYTINHWNCKQDGGYKWLFSAYTVTSNLNLYADFTYNDYTISFVDTKFDHDIDPLTVTYDKPFTFPEVSQEGYTVSEWQDENGNAFSDGVYRHVGDLTLFSKWSANKYSITLNPNGGEIDGIVSSKTITATYDSQYELPTPTRTNCVFVGWYDSNDKKSLI